MNTITTTLRVALMSLAATVCVAHAVTPADAAQQDGARGVASLASTSYRSAPANTIRQGALRCDALDSFGTLRGGCRG